MSEPDERHPNVRLNGMETAPHETPILVVDKSGDWVVAQYRLQWFGYDSRWEWIYADCSDTHLNDEFIFEPVGWIKLPLVEKIRMSEPQELSEYGQPVVWAQLDRVVIDTPPQPLSEEVVRDMGKVTVTFDNFVPPSNWQEPNFEEIYKPGYGALVHEWRGYATNEIIALWPTFTDIQKQAIAEMLDGLASNEHWD